MSGQQTFLDRAKLRARLRFFEEVPTTAIRVPTFSQAIGRHLHEMSNTALENNAGIRPVRRHFYREMGRGFSDQTYREALERLDLTLTRMEISLAQNERMMGNRFGLADISVIPTIERMEDLGLADMWQRFPSVTRCGPRQVASVLCRDLSTGFKGLRKISGHQEVGDPSRYRRSHLGSTDSLTGAAPLSPAASRKRASSGLRPRALQPRMSQLVRLGMPDLCLEPRHQPDRIGAADGFQIFIA